MIRPKSNATAVAFVACVVLASPATAQSPAGSWQTSGRLLEGRGAPQATLVLDGTVLVTGGEGGKNGRFADLASAEIFDPATGSSIATEPMRVARYAHAAVRLADGHVLVAGGFNRDRHLSTAELFDPATRRFTPVADMAAPLAGMSASLLRDGRVLLAGGQDAARKSVATTELFDPATGNFRAGPALLGPRAGHSALSLPDGRIVLVGGIDGSQEIKRVEIYDPIRGEFTAQGETAEVRGWATASLLASGKIVLAGGTNVEVYDPETGQSQAPRTLSAPRVGHGAAVLPDGRVLLAGGWKFPLAAQGKALADVELVDPATGKSAPGPPLTTAHAQPAVVSLADGRVLVISGIRAFGSTGGINAFVEIYSP